VRPCENTKTLVLIDKEIKLNHCTLPHLLLGCPLYPVINQLVILKKINQLTLALPLAQLREPTETFTA
jgi:hypothetical protein